MSRAGNKYIRLFSYVFTVLALILLLNQGKAMAKVTHIKTYGAIDEYRLDNGLKILLKQNPEAPLISFQVWYRVGSRNERSGYTGLAHYLEHMMFKGTKQFRKGEIAQAIELKGGLFNAFTSDDYTAYYENFAPEHLELGIKIESDRMRNAAISQQELSLERSVVISELEGRDNSPSSILYRSMKAAAYDVHPYKNPIIGWIDDLHNIDAKVMREFYDTFYHPNNSVAVLVGNFDKTVALNLIDKYFSVYIASALPKPPVAKEPEQLAYKELDIKQEGFVKLLAIAFHIPEFAHADSAALQLFGDIGFGGTSSRLYKKLVDNGLAISVSGYPESNIDASVFRVIVNLTPEADILQVQKIVEAELEAMKTNITADELKRAKARVEASSVFERDGIYEEGLQIAYFEMVANDWTKYVDWVDIINKVSLDDLKRVGAKYFMPANETVVRYLPSKPAESLVANVIASEAKQSIATNVGGSGIATATASPRNDVALDEELSVLESGSHRSYGSGAGVVERIDPAQMKRLTELTKPKYAKNYAAKIAKNSLHIRSFPLYEGGPTVIFKEDHNLPIVYARAMVMAGSVTDDSSTLGRSYLTANMLDRGTTKKDKFEISELLDLLGSDIEFRSDKEYAEISLSSLSKNLDATLELLDEMLKQTAFADDELSKLKVETVASIKQEDEYPSRIASRELTRLIYPAGHPYYSNSVAERLAAVNGTSIGQLKDFYYSKYTAPNMLISVVGDITEGELKAKLGKVFKGLNSGGVSKLEKAVIANVPVTNGTTAIFSMPNKEQVEINLGHSTEISRSHPDFYSTLLANYSLGGRPLSSKLGLVVRDEHGLVYNIRSNFKASVGAGAFTVTLGCNPANADKAISLTKEVLAQFLAEGVNATDLEANKLYLTGSFAARNLSSNEELAGVLSGILLHGLGNDYIENYSKLINAVTLDEVNAAARKHIRPDKLNVTIAGPYTKQ